MDITTPSLRTACADLNGQMRGKRLPARHATQLEYSGQRMPLSVLTLDLWGADIEDSPLVHASGDADGQLRCTERGPVPMPWLPEPATLVPMWMYTDDGAPFDADPRHALARVLSRYSKQGWKVIAATELEFTLVDDSGGALDTVRSPMTGRPLTGQAINSVTALDSFAHFFDDLYDGAEAMGIQAQAAISESGLGQFEINLDHGPAMRVADDTWLFKSLVRGIARKHGMAASFMAKPFDADAGNGLHVHFSVLDDKKRNIFDNGHMTGSAVMKQAVAGCVAGMPGATLIFAPNGNSYARMTPENHAPIGASWGYENRTTAIRIPGGPPAARRIEHRSAGGDTNPYLVMAAILGTAIIGIEDGLSPPDPILGNAYGQRILKCPTSWDDAIDRFATSPRMTRVFRPRLVEMLAMVKRQEQIKTNALSANDQILSVFERV
ncbi:glutamine synthetase family protein [Pseudoruegeria sp. SK021]|uniref:glutamine synthetase family protein n=1 Tax=Pseudoruegeria sp. SK021 TaxID=1933035 RepID=UPI000A25898A|nr:glutamine synthetase family protein [Pseudoruegeria sp. SK021]OSP54264.1 glutamine synthetase [Pseudoruegeria sp. SK021]